MSEWIKTHKIRFSRHKPVKILTKGSKLQILISKLREFYLFKLYFPVESFFTRLYENLIRLSSWIPYLWKEDRDWDYAHVIGLIEFKLKRMLRLFQECKMHDHKDNIKQIKHALTLIKPVLDDFIIHKQVFKSHEKKWGKIQWKRLGKDENGYCRASLSRSKIKNEKQKKQEHKEAKKLYKILRQQELKSSKDFWNYIDQHYRGWWCQGKL